LKEVPLAQPFRFGWCRDVCEFVHRTPPLAVAVSCAAIRATTSERQYLT
jgi:hypothetical protein